MDHRITTSTEKANRVPTFTESESSYARSGTENAFISQKQPKNNNKPPKQCQNTKYNNKN